jgi:hypothetical protein
MFGADRRGLIRRWSDRLLSASVSVHPNAVVVFAGRYALAVVAISIPSGHNVRASDAPKNVDRRSDQFWYPQCRRRFAGALLHSIASNQPDARMPVYFVRRSGPGDARHDHQQHSGGARRDLLGHEAPVPNT